MLCVCKTTVKVGGTIYKEGERCDVPARVVEKQPALFEVVPVETTKPELIEPEEPVETENTKPEPEEPEQAPKRKSKKRNNKRN